jgi:hypothetical protein
MMIHCNLSADPTISGLAPEYSCIAPLRLLALKKSDPDTWQRIQLLMDHDEERRMETIHWKMFQVNVVDFLIKVCGFDFFTEADVFRVLGIIRTNSLHVQHEYLMNQDVSARAVFPTFSFCSHSCVSNAKYR